MEAIRAGAGSPLRQRMITDMELAENVLLSAADYRAPLASPVFSDLRAIPSIASDVDRLASLCVGPVSAIPSLEDFLAGRSVETAVVIRPATATMPALVPGVYIGAYPVVDGADFAAVTKLIGDKVELVARIMEVHEDKTKYGRPYVFLNFGHWKGKIAKVNIWSSGLKKFASPPNKSWENKWVSVTGLIDPVWENKKHGYRHVSITISDSSQIRVITETEAKRRLASRFPTPQPVETPYQPFPTPPRPVPSGFAPACRRVGDWGRRAFLMKGVEECRARIAVRPRRRSARTGRHMAIGASGARAAGGASMSGPARC